MFIPGALIFDVDGTLADTERDGHRPAFNSAFAEAGLDWHWSVAEYGRLLRVTGGKERMTEFMRDNPINNININNISNFIANLHEAKNRFYAARVKAGDTPLRPGVKRLLTEARDQGIRLAIATTTTRANVTALLEANLGAESLRWFEIIATADEISDKKPSAAVYDYVLTKMGLHARDCVAFEDSLNGLRSAQAAGLVTIMTINTYTREHDLASAELILDQLGEQEAPMQIIGGHWASRLSSGTAYFDLKALDRLFETVT